MRRSASEIIRNLEMRIAHLERPSKMRAIIDKYKSMSLEEMLNLPYSEIEDRELWDKEVRRKNKEEDSIRFKRQSAFIKSEIESTGWNVREIYRDVRNHKYLVSIFIGRFRHTISFNQHTDDEKLLAPYIYKILPLMTSKKRDLMRVASEAVLAHDGNAMFPNLFSRLGVEKSIPKDYPEKAEVETMIRDFARAVFYRNPDFQEDAIEVYQQSYWTPRLEDHAIRNKIPFKITNHNLWVAMNTDPYNPTISDDQYKGAKKLLRAMDKQEEKWRNYYKKMAQT